MAIMAKKKSSCRPSSFLLLEITLLLFGILLHGGRLAHGWTAPSANKAGIQRRAALLRPRTIERQLVVAFSRNSPINVDPRWSNDDANGMVSMESSASSLLPYSTKSSSRRQWISASIVGPAVGLLFAATATPAAVAAASNQPPVPFPYTNAQLKDIIIADVVDRQFLATGDLTRLLYADSATFTDEIDTYALDQWIVGTRKLFVGDGSSVRLVGNTVDVADAAVTFRFDEDLMFNIPFLRPTGYITSYREYWDQDTFTVLKSAQFFGGKSKK
jgi:hypothetical protein